MLVPHVISWVCLWNLWPVNMYFHANNGFCCCSGQTLAALAGRDVTVRVLLPDVVSFYVNAQICISSLFHCPIIIIIIVQLSSLLLFHCSVIINYHLLLYCRVPQFAGLAKSGFLFLWYTRIAFWKDWNEVIYTLVDFLYNGSCLGDW